MGTSDFDLPTYILVGLCIFICITFVPEHHHVGRTSRRAAAVQGARGEHRGHRDRRPDVLRLLHLLGHLQAGQHQGHRHHALPWRCRYVSS